MQIIDNINHTVKSDLQKNIQRGSEFSVAAACFSIYAYRELKEWLEGIDELRFISTSPTFVTEKAAASGSSAFKVSRYYHTDWMPEDALHLSIDGLNMDAVYENLVRQITGEKLQTDSGESLKESVERDEKKKQLEKQIAALENKIRREKQLNRQMEMNAELKILKKELCLYDRIRGTD